MKLTPRERQVIAALDPFPTGRQRRTLARVVFGSADERALANVSAILGVLHRRGIVGHQARGVWVLDMAARRRLLRVQVVA